MATACMQALRLAPAAARPRHERAAVVRVRSAAEKKPQRWVEGATVAGGGYGGSCEIEARAAWHAGAARPSSPAGKLTHRAFRFLRCSVAHRW